ncbi:MAG: hypothetical protein JWO24_2782 [Rhodospirillales bacterium]|nr:hypothetical protein [Rhodospirillales bacterium]
MTRAFAILVLLALPAWAQAPGTIEFQPEPGQAAIEGPAAPTDAPPTAIPLEFLPEPLPVSMNAPPAPGHHAPAPIQLMQAPAPTAQAAAEIEIPGLPSPPAGPPPPPPNLPPRPAQGTARPRPPTIPPPPGLEALPNGGLRIQGAALDARTRAALADYGRRLAALPNGRVTVLAEVSGPAEDAHLARRLSLARAQAAKAALVEGGLDETRIDLRPLGRTTAGVDRLDVLPPGVDRSEPPR